MSFLGKNVWLPLSRASCDYWKGVEGPVFTEVGGGSWERAGFGHRGCGGPVFNAPKRVLALGEPGRHG